MTWTLRWGRVSHRRAYGPPVKTAIDKGTCHASKYSLLQNDAGTHVSYWNQSDSRKSGFLPQKQAAKSGGGLHTIRLFLVCQVAS